MHLPFELNTGHPTPMIGGSATVIGFTIDLMIQLATVLYP